MNRFTGLISIFLLIVTVPVISGFDGGSNNNTSPTSSVSSPTNNNGMSELADYYKQIQSSSDFIKYKLLYPKADYLQPWMLSAWEYEDYKSYLEKIKASGMEYVVLQYVAEAEVINDKAKLTENYFHLKDYKNPHLSSVYSRCAKDVSVSQFDVVDSLFMAAQEVGIKVYLGTLLSEQWWDDDFTDVKWRTEMAALEQLLISYFITKYKNNMADTFYGIYYTPEAYGNMKGYEKYWGKMLESIREFVHLLDPSLKFMVSLYCSDQHPFDNSGEKTIEKKMQEFVLGLLTNNGNTVLKNGDIVSVQDKLCTNTTSVEYNAKFLYAVRDALKVLTTDYNNDLRYHIIVENMTSDLNPASIDRYILQILISGQLADDLMCFSYAHYHMPKDEFNRPLRE